MTMSCQRCGKTMKERLVTDEFSGDNSQVTVTGIRAGICSYCGCQAMDEDMLDEIDMFVRPLLARGIGMHLLDTPEITIDLGHSLHPSAIDIAGPSFQHQAFMRQRQYQESVRLASMGAGLEIAEEAA